ncbi:MAG: NADH-quinone oxidoreductase subunit K [Bryobacterales bacterium]|nr:NADH-quinone oxidoreductase subunit K [Bryobacteraceae bacterium]MDW8356058.1 NADH-quinone oxidoreductase subunit K [Bryobacterales bacterium]
MTFLLALLVGALYAGAIYMITRRSLVKLIVGLALLSHAAHLLIFSAGGTKRAAAPLVCEGATPRLDAVADPLPQALILTAIVISFGVLSFSLALLSRAFQITGEEDVDQLRTTEE